MDLNLAVRDWLVNCPGIKPNGMSFQVLAIKDGATGMITVANDKISQDITGVSTYVYSMSLVAYQSLTTLAADINLENFIDFAKVRDIADWVNEQNRERNFPDFAPCRVTSVEAPVDPSLGGVDYSRHMSNPLAKYLLSIKIHYERIE